MQRNLIFRVILILGGLLFSACSVKAPTERPMYNENGSFYVSKITSNGISTINEKTYGFPTTRIYNIEICFKDHGTKKEIIRNTFEISNGKESKILKTSENGCLVYDDRVDFNFLTYDSNYIHLKRKVISRGSERGYQEINYAVNPWRRSKAEETFYDLDKGDKPSQMIDSEKTQDYLSGIGARKAQLWVDKVDNLMLSSGKITNDGYISKLELHISPEIKFLDMDGETVFHKINKGQFIVKAYLINKKSTALIMEDKKVISLSDTKSLEEPLEMIDHKIKFERELNIPLIPTRGEVEVGLIVSPSDDLKYLKEKLKPFHGVYYLGPVDQMAGRKNGSLSAVSTSKFSLFKKDGYDFSLEKYTDDLEGKYVREVFTGYRNHENKIENAQKAGAKIDDKDMLPFKTDSDWAINRYIVTINTPKFQSYGKISLPTLEVNYNSSVCIKDPFNGYKPLRNQDFKIHTAYQDESGKRSLLVGTTGEDGCFSWPDRLVFKAYDKEHYHIQYFILENKELSFTESHGIAINPWDFGFTFGSALVERKDLLEGGQDLDNKPPSTVFIPHFSYRNLGFDYIIDEQLNLTLRKHLIVRIDPDYMAYHAMTRVKPIWPLYPGRYLLKLVLMRNFYEDPYHAGEYISHVTKFVEVFYGRVITDVTFEIDDIRLMGSRNLLMIEIFPVYEDKLMVDDKGQIVPKDPALREDKTKKSWDQLIAHDSGLVSKPYIGPVMILNESEAGPVLPGDQKNGLNSLNENNLDKLMRSLPAKKQEQVLKSISEKLKISKYVKITPEDVTSINQSRGNNYISPDELSTYIAIAQKELNFPIAEKQVPVRFKYEKSNIKDESGNVLEGLDKTDPRLVNGELGIDDEHDNLNLYVFGQYDQTDADNFINSPYDYAASMKKLFLNLNSGSGYDENGKKIYKTVNVDELEVGSAAEDQLGLQDELIPIKYYDERSKKEMTGYAPPRFDITTTRMIERGEKIVEAKKAKALEVSELKYFLEQNNLDYINLSDHERTDSFLFQLSNPLWHKKDHAIFSQYLSGRFHTFPDEMILNVKKPKSKNAFSPQPSFSKQELEKFVQTGEMTEEFAQQLCKFWFYDYARGLYPIDVFEKMSRNIPMYISDVAHEILPQSHYDAANACMSYAKEYWNAFVIERKIRAHSLKSFEHQKGLSVNMSVNSGVNWGYGQSTTTSRSSGVDISTGLDKLLPISLPFNMTANTSLSLSRSKSYSNGTDEGAGNSVNLVVQRNEFDLVFDKYEHCVSIKLNPAGFNLSPDSKVYMRKGGVEIYWNDELSAQQKSAFLDKGFFICTGEVIEEEIKVPENYYYITQHFNVGHSFDMPSMKNRWFDVAIRGEQTLTAFSSLLYTEQYGAAKNRSIQTPIGRINDPLFALLPIYSKLPTSYYGIYSLPVDPRTFLGFEWKLDGLKK